MDFPLAFCRLEELNTRAVSSTLHSLQEAISSGQPSLTEILSQTKAIAARLNLVEVEHWGDAFGSDWPQQFVVPASEFKRIVDAVTARWADEFEKRGVRVFDIQKLVAALGSL